MNFKSNPAVVAAAGISIILISIALSSRGWLRETGTSSRGNVYVVGYVGLFKSEVRAPDLGIVRTIDCKLQHCQVGFKVMECYVEIENRNLGSQECTPLSN